MAGREKEGGHAPAAGLDLDSGMSVVYCVASLPPARRENHLRTRAGPVPLARRQPMR
jgi:hypothetical protein